MLKLAYESGASGYLAGRSIWLSAFDQYPDLKRVEKDMKKSISFMKKLNSITKSKAKSIQNYLHQNFTIKNPETFQNYTKNFKKSEFILLEKFDKHFTYKFTDTNI